MSVRLLYADHNIVAVAVGMLRLTDGQIDGLALMMAMPDHPAVMVDDIPAILSFVVIDIKGQIGTGILRRLGHLSGPAATWRLSCGCCRPS